MAERTPLVRVATRAHSEAVPTGDWTPLSALPSASGGRRDWGALTSANEPTTGMSDGDQYYNTTIGMLMQYDSGRGKWLSVESVCFYFGRSGNTAAGSYYRGLDGLTFSSTNGYTALFNGTAVAIAYTRDDTDSATFEVTNGGASLATLLSTALKGKDVTLNANFAADDVLGVMNQAGGNITSNVQGWVKIRWRA